MAAKPETNSNAPRLMTRAQAAAYCGIALSTFSMWVANYKMPPPIPGTRRWDRVAIDARLSELGGIKSADAQEDEFDRWERENGKFGRSSSSATSTPNTNPKRSAVDSWRTRKAGRDKHKPIHGLGAKELRVLRFMADHPECTTTDVIPDAGEKTMEAIASTGCIREGGRDARGKREWHITDEGRAELRREETYRDWKF